MRTGKPSAALDREQGATQAHNPGADLETPPGVGASFPGPTSSPAPFFLREGRQHLAVPFPRRELGKVLTVVLVRGGERLAFPSLQGPKTAYTSTPFFSLSVSTVSLSASVNAAV